jgi:hypothetical protein
MCRLPALAPLSFASGAKAGKLGHRLVGIDADLGQFGQQSSHRTVGEALGAQCRVEARPERIIVDQPGDLRLQGARLSLEQCDDLVDAGHHLGVHRAAASLLLHDKIVGDLAQPRHQRGQALLACRRRFGRPEVFGDRETGDDARIEPVGLLQDAHGFGIAPHASRIGQAARNAVPPQQQEGEAFVAAGCLMATSCTPWRRQNAVSAAIPAASLSKLSKTPDGTTWASSRRLETSTPQMISVTVTCLVRTIGFKRLFGRA